MKYQISHKRELNTKEKGLLIFLFQREKKEWVTLVDDLKVIARCGCGNCPTILFGKNFDDNISEGNLLIDYYLKTKSQGIVGIGLFGNEERPTELELYSVDGLFEVSEIPENYQEAKKVIN